jgi:hypothetical protein
MSARGVDDVRRRGVRKRLTHDLGCTEHKGDHNAIHPFSWWRATPTSSS